MRGWLPAGLACALVLLWLAACGDDDGGGGGGEDAGPASDAGAMGTDAGPDEDGGGGDACSSHADCDDGQFCNGEELCMPGASDADPRGCVPAPEAACMEGRECDEDADACATPCDDEADADGDGHDAVECGGDDCDDGDRNRYPGNSEVCDLEGHDEDCNPETFGSRDADNDGYVDDRCCNTDDAGDTACGDDCNDGRPGVHPDLPEVCDHVDNDCNGSIDEGVTVSGYADEDRDLHGDESVPMMECAGTAGFATEGGDCDDTDPRRHEAQVEICDGIDNNCNGEVDEAPAAVTWYGDADGDGFGSPDTATTVSCIPIDGFSLLPTDCDDTRSGVNPGADEQCNGRDDDCNGEADFAITDNDGEDDDGDGFADAMCGIGSDCDDEDPATHPGAVEICDGRDNDCDGVSDDGTDTTVWYPDLDGDTYGDPAGPTVTTCEPPPGYTLRAGDCDDSNPLYNPGRPDRCDGVDQDCDGVVDEDAFRMAYYPDADSDGFGDASMVTLSCMTPSGLLLDGSDCDDSTDTVNPDATEECNGVDDDCDSTIDEGFDSTVTCGLGACEVTVGVCTDGSPTTCTPGDPTAETCNGIDDNCDGTVDNEPAASESCGDPSTTIASCDSGTCSIVGCVPGNGDCNGFLGDGCETDLQTSTTHCGTCGHGCKTGDTCVGGVCQNEPIDIDAGESHTCVLLGSGAVYCWGANGRGQLGDGTTALRTSAVEAGISGAAMDVGAGYDHSCAVLNDGTVECWGDNNNRVVQGTSTNPVPDPGVATSIGDAIGVDLGSDHTCVLRSSGRINCWGRNSEGRLGGSCGFAVCGGNNSVSVNGITAASMFDIGQGHSVAQRTSPSVRVWAWGRGEDGRLGSGTGDNTGVGVVDASGGAIADAISVAASTRSSCIVRTSGDVMCTGHDGYGQLGDGAADSTRNGFDFVTGLTDGDEVWAGYYHYCVLRDTGEVSCWGRNLEGQLGVTTAETSQPEPIAVTGFPGQVIQIAAGLQHTCAILDTRRVICWGGNGLGQLGVGDTDPHTGFQFVTGLP